MRSKHTRIYWVEPADEDIRRGDEAIGYLQIFTVGRGKAGHIQWYVSHGGPALP